MLRRNATGTFAGMWVFPGGRVDPDDAAGGANEFDAARRAAAREAVEEAGLIVDPSDLVALSHWTPPEGPGRRFPTWFFLAATDETTEVTVDGGEIHEHAWISPADALRRRDEGHITLAPPTWMTLHHLSGFADLDSALAGARSQEPTRFATRILRDGDVMVATWEGDVAYRDGDLAAPGGRHRLRMDPAGWKVELDRGEDHR
jgi:8-oxo-dGTP pyrophosphatase MutT (NUDIX family)